MGGVPITYIDRDILKAAAVAAVATVGLSVRAAGRGVDQQRFSSAQRRPRDDAVRIAVIGAGGAVGSECVRRLLSQGFSVRCVVRNPEIYADNNTVTSRSSGDSSFLDALEDAVGEFVYGNNYLSKRKQAPTYTAKFGTAEIVKGSVTDEASLLKALRGVRSVIFAASSSSSTGRWGRDHPHAVNYMGVQKAARAAKENGIRNFVLSIASSQFPLRRPPVPAVQSAPDEIIPGVPITSSWAKRR